MLLRRLFGNSNGRVPILGRYICLEIAVPFVLALFVFTGVLFLVRILKLFEMVVNNNVPFGEVLSLFLYVIPRFLEVAIPMSLLIGVLFAFGRMSAESELVVMRATGITLRRIAKPVAFVAGICFLVTALISLWITPYANYQFGLGLFQIAKAQASRGLIAGAFNTIGDFTIYAESIGDQGGRLSDVIIADQRNAAESVYFAKSGQILTDEGSRTVTLRLFDGAIHRGTLTEYNLTYFDINNIRLNESELMDSDLVKNLKKANEMSPGELNVAISELRQHPALEKKDLRQLRSLQVEYQRRFVIPVACLCITFIGMALGIQPSRGGAAWGAVFNIAAGVVVILIYYFFLGISTALSQDGVAPAWLLMWIPNIIFAGFAYWLFRLVESERWMAVSSMVGNLAQAVSKKLGLQRQGEATP